MRAKLIWIEMIERRLLYSSVIPRSEGTRNLAFLEGAGCLISRAAFAEK
jgi:hypothetical protein